MKQRSILWKWAGFAVATFGGTILHFLYDWAGGSILVSPFSGVNESTWEHMKLLFWPLFLFALVQQLFFRDQKNYWCVKLAEILLGLILIPVLFYTYNGIFGKSPDWINIAIFFISDAAAYIYEAFRLHSKKPSCQSPKSAIAVLGVIALLFVLFTFRTPEIGIFKDPLTGTFGI